MSEHPEHPPNRLASESSPYLRQHAGNPVDWHPWGAEAIALARREDRPIFLSVGYSACHWCHVMAHESFEDEATAAFLNEHFVPIKLDREERPDLDALYMRSVTLMTGSGGWPLSVFLTPDLRPFYGGTYFPPEPRYGMASFMQVLRGVAEAYRSKRGDVQASADQLLDAVRQSFEGVSGPAPGPTVSDRASTAIVGRFEPRHGGFGGGPKFPQPPLLEFLLDEAGRTGDEGLLDQVLFTLDKMEAGGVRDQVGGAFHRYSVDTEWRVPHYEKMLYDNGQLASLYARAFGLTGRERYRRVAGEILTDLRRTMVAPGGGFVAALDADSEGEEGRFYLWTPGEVRAVLGPEEGRFIADLYGIMDGKGLEGATPHRTRDLDEAARGPGEKPQDVSARVRADLDELVAARARRVPPGVDTKVLTDWNALAAGGFLRGHRVTGSATDLETGLTTLKRTWERCWTGDALFHVWDGERAKVPGFLADYAYLARAGWAAYESTGDRTHLERTGRLLKAAVERFGGGGAGPWADARGSEAGDLVVTVRDTDDGVLPAPLSVIARMLWNWERLTGASWAGEALDGLLRAEGGGLARNPGAQPLLAGLVADRALPPVEVVVAGPSMDALRDLLETARRAAPVGALVLPLLDDSGEGAGSAYSLFEGRQGVEEPVAFVCVERTCGLPISDAGRLEDALAKARESSRKSYLRALGAE